MSEMYQWLPQDFINGFLAVAAVLCGIAARLQSLKLGKLVIELTDTAKVIVKEVKPDANSD